MTTAGQLKVVASQDIGELGEKESSAVTYEWKWYYHVPGLLLWAILILVLVLIKANRSPRAWLILIPLLIVNLLWSVLRQLLHVPSAQGEMFGMVVNSLAAAVAVLWLVGDKIGNRSRLVTFLLALVIMAGVGVAGTVSYGMADFSEQTLSVLMLLGVLVLSTLLGFVLSGWRCRKRYSSVVFMLWLAVWVIAAAMASMLVLYTLVFIIQGVSISTFKVLMVACIVGLIFGLCIYIINLPYMILGLRSAFFRERFYACLRLKSMAGAPGPAAESGQFAEQEPTLEASKNGDSD
ncbi:MAG TPA: hypothetical protein VMW16_11825 [Sedimentisphaerales bacterium]|nr:hypothetical protein [Sedimentisphaerales bacterium]